MSAIVKTLEKAVKDEINVGMVPNSVEFSSHTITQNIRQKVNDGILEIDGLNVEDVDGVMTQRIEHDDVRHFVHAECGGRNCFVPGYERKWNTLGGTRGYWSWSPVGTHMNTKDDDNGIFQPVMPNPVMAPPPHPSQTIQSKPVHNDSLKYMDPMIIGKVVNYFENRLAKGKPASLHDAQKRMKRNPLTIAQIKQIALDEDFTVRRELGQAECDSIVIHSVVNVSSI